ncbi:hypothetical protein APR11_006412 [Nocardia amikacinitolerans]|uniref:hypothetical protein n=1 Tax=Nocardia amikacinitolerans TaxID=756689 RepID=UPI0020A2E715|nr:hypothetical protein [Nocardia amikacinitolerans]MCP2299953.1 hypothetical protein [Nocardia amikacinitolerans]
MDIEDSIASLHADLAAWLGSPAPFEVFERFAAAQHERFSMVSVSGAVLERDALLAGLREARNARPGLRIEISEITELARFGENVVVRFLERHLTEDENSARRVTAVLSAVEGFELGYRWLTVHETPVAE